MRQESASRLLRLRGVQRLGLVAAAAATAMSLTSCAAHTPGELSDGDPLTCQELGEKKLPHVGIGKLELNGHKIVVLGSAVHKDGDSGEVTVETWIHRGGLPQGDGKGVAPPGTSELTLEVNADFANTTEIDGQARTEYTHRSRSLKLPAASDHCSQFVATVEKPNGGAEWNLRNLTGLTVSLKSNLPGTSENVPLGEPVRVFPNSTNGAGFWEGRKSVEEYMKTAIPR